MTSKGQIVIPSGMRKGAFGPGSKVAVIAMEDHIEVRPIEDIEWKMDTALASERSLSKLWDSPEEDEAWDHL
ncbi:MAG: AbrB/MazE/SpoVT family DNA-binding domain-containing protein [Methanolobus sp.]|nr:AbrB/MazE/SpoVT family DNA-binding domain-containing protein [Methanolobus sp.]